MKNKITAALSEEIQKEPAFIAWELYQVAGALVSNLEVKAFWE